VTTPVESLLEALDREAAGKEMLGLATELFPLCRSITGDGVRATLQRLADDLPMELHEVPTGTRVFDWTIPKEWNVRDAWIKGPDGAKVVDFSSSNLHVLNYSIPAEGKLPLSKLKEHLHTLPNDPDAIPYKTSYFSERWGFCLSHRQLEALPEGEYEYRIDSSLEDGSLTYGEVVMEGREPDEILFSAHVCHPSLANDNLSAVSVLHRLALALRSIERKWTYRFIFAPGTIGAITWLARNSARLDAVRAGLIVAGVGDRGAFTYKRSRRHDAEIDMLMQRALGQSGHDYQAIDFTPDGYDERQYNSPGIGLPVGRLSRTPDGTYPEYHTSGDNLGFIHGESLAGALEVLLRVCALLESSTRFVSLSPRGEPQLGRRGLYSALGGHRDTSLRERAMIWMLNYSDGEHCLADIAERSGFSLELIEDVAAVLEDKGLLGRVETA
jgi:aminopeptidase-like protein